MAFEENEANFKYGLWEVDIPELGERTQGKVRDIWDLDRERVLLAATDRLSAFDKVIATIPQKGQVLNCMSAWWFNRVDKDACKLDITSHMIDVPHPNASIVRKAETTLPIEVVLRSHLAGSSTTTSVSRNYFTGNEDGREGKVIYGINFPPNLVPNQPFPEDLGYGGIVVTPTTKAPKGQHDRPLTQDQTRKIVDTRFSDGEWDLLVGISLGVYKFLAGRFLAAGLILADTKLEYGLIDGEWVLIDEIGTPDSSRLWRADTYTDRLSQGLDPENYDKERVRNWLAKRGYTGDGKVPTIPDEEILANSTNYKIPYQMLTGRELPVQNATPGEIRQAVLTYLGK